MKRILALLSDGSDYASELALHLKTRRNFIFKPVFFNNINELNKFVTNFAIDMLLCDESSSKDIPQGIDNVCILCEDNEIMESSDTESLIQWHRIFKYQSSEAIVKDIIDYYKRKQSKTIEELKIIRASKRIVCVCSPIGGCYSSTFALALADYYSKGGKTLFISFDPFFEYPGEDKSQADKNLTDLLYCAEIIRSGIADFIAKMSFHRDSLDYLSGVSHWFDIADMSRGKMKTIIESLSDSGRYENIVFDLKMMGEACIELLAGCREIYVPVRHGFNASKVMDEWERQIVFANHGQILDKVKELELPYDELLEGEYSFDVLLKGHLGQFIENLEGLQYSR